ncbi:MAG: hypothetical protein F6K28_56545 [Microcoleus sp. SIO2G3]|nr:hypothetical protein [Microcoleus sp. SIO2G3]
MLATKTANFSIIEQRPNLAIRKSNRQGKFYKQCESVLPTLSDRTSHKFAQALILGKFRQGETTLG